MAETRSWWYRRYLFASEILGALSRALMPSMDERAHLFHLAGETMAPQSLPRRDVPAGVVHLLRSLTDLPAYVVDAKYDILAWNDMATRFLGDLGRPPDEQRNVLRWSFLTPPPANVDEAQRRAFARSSVAGLRAASGRYPDDPGIAELIADLSAGSALFRELWADHEVAARRHLRKTIDHPGWGRIDLECQVMHIPDRDQRMILYAAEPGSPTFTVLQRMRAAKETTGRD